MTCPANMVTGWGFVERLSTAAAMLGTEATCEPMLGRPASCHTHGSSPEGSDPLNHGTEHEGWGARFLTGHDFEGPVLQSHVGEGNVCDQRPDARQPGLRELGRAVVPLGLLARVVDPLAARHDLGGVTPNLKDTVSHTQESCPSITGGVSGPSRWKSWYSAPAPSGVSDPRLSSSMFSPRMADMTWRMAGCSSGSRNGGAGGTFMSATGQDAGQSGDKIKGQGEGAQYRLAPRLGSVLAAKCVRTSRNAPWHCSIQPAGHTAAGPSRMQNPWVAISAILPASCSGGSNMLPGTQPQGERDDSLRPRGADADARARGGS